MQQLSYFPNFLPINNTEREVYERIVQSFDVYSDFNFNSVLSWDTNNTHAVSIHNNNIVLLLNDYITQEPFLTILGEEKLNESIDTLINFCAQNSLNKAVQLVPECVASKLDTRKFYISEDINNFDYILSTKNISCYKGNQYKSKRRAAKKCADSYNITTQILQNPTEIEKTTSKITQLLDECANIKLQLNKDADIELEKRATINMVNAGMGNPNIIITLACIDEKLVGFSIDEILPRRQALSHYFRTLPNIMGLSEFLNQQVASYLLNHDVINWNWEQDLGIETLRDMKNSYRPIFKQKKYTVRLAEDVNN